MDVLVYDMVHSVVDLVVASVVKGAVDWMVETVVAQVTFVCLLKLTELG